MRDALLVHTSDTPKQSKLNRLESTSFGGNKPTCATIISMDLLEMEPSEVSFLSEAGSPPRGVSAFSTPSRSSSDCSRSTPLGAERLAGAGLTFAPTTELESSIVHALHNDNSHLPSDPAQAEGSTAAWAQQGLPPLPPMYSPPAASEVSANPWVELGRSHPNEAGSADGTPIVSNNFRKSVGGAEAGRDFSQAVETVATGVHKAFDSLRKMAKPYLSSPSRQSEGGVPDGVDTSCDSNESRDLDLKELQQELKPRSRERQYADEKKEEVRPPSAGSFDTIGRPIPAQPVGGTPATAFRPRPVPMSQNAEMDDILRIDSDDGYGATRHTPVNNFSRPPRSPPQQQGPQSSPRTQIHVTSGAHAASPYASPVVHQATSPRTPPRNPPKANSPPIESPPRVMTPIMRIRLGERANPGPAPPEEPEKPRKTSDEIRSDKQRRWKEKMKQAEKKRQEERKNLDKEGDSTRARRAKPRTKRRTAREDDSRAGPPPVFCQDNLTLIFEKLAGSRCGGLVDTISVYDDEDSGDSDSEDGSYEDESKIRSLYSAEDGSPSRASRAGSSLLTDGTYGTSTVMAADPNTIGINDKNFIRVFIAGAKTRGISLLLHKRNSKQIVVKPTRTVAFLKPGTSDESGVFSGPRLVWETESGEKLGSVELLDIRALEKASPRELEKYPVAMPGRTLVMKMVRGADVVFETKNEDAARRFVHGMRWVVARLSFDLVVGNLNGSCELLDVGKHGTQYDGGVQTYPKTPLEESRWTKAMNDVTNHLVDKSVVV